jgi:hypothetical protein
LLEFEIILVFPLMPPPPPPPPPLLLLLRLLFKLDEIGVEICCGSAARDSLIKQNIN